MVRENSAWKYTIRIAVGGQWKAAASLRQLELERVMEVGIPHLVKSPMDTRTSSRLKTKPPLDTSGCISEDTSAPAQKKRKKTSAKSSRSNGTVTLTRHKVKGKLRYLLDMPVDVLYEVGLRVLCLD